MKKIQARNILIISLILFTLLSFWLFSRFTVDDAFITWRYGKNLVESGHWNYNPADIDKTQAYTNPIYAFISIIPHLLHIDVVLFFKCFSVCIGFYFLFYLYKIGIQLEILLLFVALPATQIHLFSGLETFLYVFLISIYFISLSKSDYFRANIFLSLLILTRPESWILILVPPILFLWENKKIKLKFLIEKNMIYFLPLIILILNFIFHKSFFQEFIPNTFYVKSINNFSLKQFIRLIIFTSPIYILIFIYRKKWFITYFIYTIILIFKYSSSQLTMNYAERFSFHLFGPTAIIIVYLLNQLEYKKINSYISYFLLSLFIICVSYIFTKNQMSHLLTYYPKLLNCHSEIGKFIKNEKTIKCFSFGDAGICAYHSSKIALDNAGLGSRLITKNKGLNLSTLNAYNPDVIILYMNKNKIRSDCNQSVLYKWSLNRNYRKVTTCYFSEQNSYLLLSKLKLQGAKHLEYKSQINKNISFQLIDILKDSPFNYWHQTL